MKMLVCTDGSKLSQQAVEEAARIAELYHYDDITIIHVYEKPADLSYLGEATTEHINRFRELMRQLREQGELILSDAANAFEKRNIKANTKLEKGHPSETIIRVAKEKAVNMIILGSRGLGGLKKTILGSVSGAVVQEASNCIVLMVKELKNDN